MIEALERWASKQTPEAPVEIELPGTPDGEKRYLKVCHVGVHLTAEQALPLGIEVPTVPLPEGKMPHLAVPTDVVVLVAAKRYGVAIGSQPGWGDVFYHLAGEAKVTKGDEHLDALAKMLGL